MTHSGAATPTYGQTGQRFVSAGAVPYNQLAPNQAPRLPTYDQKPMLDQPNPQQQAYLQHVELIQQHRAVEAHQRLMQQRNDQVCGLTGPTVTCSRHVQTARTISVSHASLLSRHGIRSSTSIQCRTTQCSLQSPTHSDTPQAMSCRTTGVLCPQ